jgi:hypothetical protein
MLCAPICSLVAESGKSLAPKNFITRETALSFFIPHTELPTHHFPSPRGSKAAS